MKLTTNLLLAGIALLMGIIIALVPPRDKSISLEHLTTTLASSPGLIDPVDLSDWLIQGRNDFTIIDVRPESVFQKSSIPGSINIPLNDILTTSKIKDNVPPGRMLFIVGQSEADGAEAALVLRSKKFDAYVIQNGFGGWVSRVLQPQKPETFTTNEDVNRWQRRDMAAAHFRGENLGNVEIAEIKPVTPPVQTGRRTKTKSEGC